MKFVNNYVSFFFKRLLTMSLIRTDVPPKALNMIVPFMIINYHHGMNFIC